MVLVNLAELPWSLEKRRNMAIFNALLDRGTLFEAGLYADPPKVLTSRASLRGRIAAARSAREVRPIRSNAWLFRSSFTLPFSMRPMMRRVSARLQARTIFRFLRGRPYCLWVNSVDAPAHALFDALVDKASMTVLDMSDDWTTFRDAHPKQRDARVFDIMARSDLMLAVNDRVMHKFAHRNSFVFGNATDFENFQRRDPAYVFHDVLPKAPGTKIVGFVGGLHRERVDELLLDLLMDSIDDVMFVFVGYSNDPALVKKLRSRPNARFFDAVPYAELPFVISAFDVAIVPHVDNEHTRGNDLLKVIDYLATGVPVVSTDTSAVREKYGDVVIVAESHADFLASVQRCLARSSYDGSKGKQVARAKDWNAVVADLEVRLAPLLTQK
jgi:glycosyltransferase involved in cell wall biosynthesis